MDWFAGNFAGSERGTWGKPYSYGAWLEGGAWFNNEQEARGKLPNC